MSSLPHLLICGTLLLSTMACAAHASGKAPGDLTGALRVGNVTRTYLVHIPNRRPPDGGYPVILAFHGGGGRGAKMVNLMKLDPLADANGFIVVYPAGLGGHWNDGRSSIKNRSDDVGFDGSAG